MTDRPEPGAPPPAAAPAVRRYAFLAYGVACYGLFLATFLYAIGFVGNLAVPRAIDSEPRAGRGTSLLVNAALLAAFAVPHSVMARGWFKRWWHRFVPPPLERSTYVLVSSLLLALLFWQLPRLRAARRPAPVDGPRRVPRGGLRPTRLR